MKYLMMIFITVYCLTTFPLSASSYEHRFSAPLEKGVLLVAAPELRDPHFYQTVILIITYGQDGAIGLVINKPTDINMRKALPDITITKKGLPPLYIGGPVDRSKLFILFTSGTPVSGGQNITDSIYFSYDKETAKKLLEDSNSTNKVRAYAGYAGWEPGQLESEIRRGAWITVKADINKVFSDSPLSLWPSLFRSPGDLLIQKYRDIPQPKG